MRNHVSALVLGLTFSLLATQGSFAFSKPEDPAKKIEAMASNKSDEITYMTIVKFNPNTGDTITSVIEPDSMDESTKTKIMAHANMVSGDGKKPAGGAATLGAFDSFLRKAGRIVNTAAAGGDWKKTAGEQFSKALGDISKTQGGGNKTMPVVEKPAPTNQYQNLPLPPATSGALRGTASEPAKLPPPPPPMSNNTGSVSAPTKLPPPPPPMAGAVPATSGAGSAPVMLPPPPPSLPAAPATSGAKSEPAQLPSAPAGLLGQIQAGTQLKKTESGGNVAPAAPGGFNQDVLNKAIQNRRGSLDESKDVEPNADWE